MFGAGSYFINESAFMRDEKMSEKAVIPKELRKEIIRLLERGEPLPHDFMYDLFPRAKAECELIYGGKERVEDILAQTMAVPLQRMRLFGNNGKGWHNKLIFGDNLQAMKELLEMKKRGELLNADGTPGIRLVYIDPPFASKRELQGSEGERAYRDKLAEAEFLEFIRQRLIFIRELLSSDGSVYVHLDYRMNAYTRILMDEIFGKGSFANEIVWCYKSFHGQTRNHFPRKHDCIHFYKRSDTSIFKLMRDESVDIRDLNDYKNWKKFIVNDREIRGGYMPRDVRFKRYIDAFIKKNGKYPDENDMVFEFRPQPIDDVWNIPYLDPKDKTERIGYPTQKPEKLLERIIRASSDKGDIVADFFIGSGTTCAVAEKLERRWIGVDCGKLAIYTTQKRMLNLRKNIGNTGAKLKSKPFAMYNAGLYDLELLWKERREEWRKFALLLFECRDKPHKIGGIQMDGYRKGKSVMVFDHHKHGETVISEETIGDIHSAIGRKVGDRVFIIAPAKSFGFFQDYIEYGNTRYYALRVPYSFIHELHRRNFSALLQPVDKDMVNESIDAVGFDFIQRPQIKYSPRVKDGTACIKITTFKSESGVDRGSQRANLETFSMLMLDFNYDGIFELGEVFFAEEIKSNNWSISFPKVRIGGDVMAIFIDIYGNEARELIPAAKFGIGKRKAVKKSSGRVKK